MPYLGESSERERLKPDWSFFTKLPGLLVALQMGCCVVGFLLGVAGSMLWRVRSGHGVFIVFSFVASLSCCGMAALRVLHLHTALCPRTRLDWNKMGLVHSGLNSVLMMIASCVMIEVASAARMLRAAGVFGFLAFSAFLAHLAWEVVTWRKNRDLHSPLFESATVVTGRDRPVSGVSEGSSDGGRDGVVRGAVAMDAQGHEDGQVGFVAMKQRPVSSFLQPCDVTSPMLYAPGWKEEAMEKGENRAEEGEKREGGERKGEKREGGEKNGGEVTENLVSNRSSSSSASTSACDWQVPS